LKAGAKDIKDPKDVKDNKTTTDEKPDLVGVLEVLWVL